MTPHVLLSLLLIASISAPDPSTTQTHDLGKMTFRQAEALNGQAVRITFVVDRDGRNRDEVILQAETLRGVSVEIYFPRGQWPGNLELGQRLAAEGQWRTRKIILGHIENGEWFEPKCYVKGDGARLIEP